MTGLEMPWRKFVREWETKLHAERVMVDEFRLEAK